MKMKMMMKMVMKVVMKVVMIMEAMLMVIKKRMIVTAISLV